MSEREPLPDDIAEAEAQLRALYQATAIKAPSSLRNKVLSAVRDAETSLQAERRGPAPGPSKRNAPKASRMKWRFLAAAAVVVLTASGVIANLETYRVRRLLSFQDLPQGPLEEIRKPTLLPITSNRERASDDESFDDPTEGPDSQDAFSNQSFFDGTKAALKAAQVSPTDDNGCPIYLWLIPDTTYLKNSKKGKSELEKLKERLPPTMRVMIQETRLSTWNGWPQFRNAKKISSNSYRIDADGICPRASSSLFTLSFNLTSSGIKRVAVTDRVSAALPQVFLYPLDWAPQDDPPPDEKK